jgi:L-amino acid N-acyltransferase YncA
VIEGRYPKEVVLKDGSDVILRPIEEADKEAVLSFYDALPREETWFFKDDPSSPDVIRRWVSAIVSGTAVSILALQEGRVVGHAAILTRTRGGRRHIGRIRIRLASDVRGKRLGNWMLFDLIRRAMDLDLELLRAEFMVGLQDEAIEAMERWDFRPEALLKGYLRDAAGNPRDYLIMIKRLHKEWSDF